MPPPRAGDLDDEALLVLTSDDPSDAERFTAQHPGAEPLLRSLRARYEARAPQLAAWAASRA